ncbi:hypothetical protein Nepgr_025767 [Nepenthes gracilis]|uniref:Uncharacterized protein n=1 Tax=Nepenthes gracilis TaxID=150966 RepID=A0AAD3Y1D7_NEPGR|nr:hypothetical protein Nepgr_025767 [Nepenthes gracilis]
MDDMELDCVGDCGGGCCDCCDCDCNCDDCCTGENFILCCCFSSTNNTTSRPTRANIAPDSSFHHHRHRRCCCCRCCCCCCSSPNGRAYGTRALPSREANQKKKDENKPKKHERFCLSIWNCFSKNQRLNESSSSIPPQSKMQESPPRDYRPNGRYPMPEELGYYGHGRQTSFINQGMPPGEGNQSEMQEIRVPSKPLGSNQSTSSILPQSKKQEFPPKDYRRDGRYPMLEEMGYGTWNTFNERGIPPRDTNPYKIQEIDVPPRNQSSNQSTLSIPPQSKIQEFAPRNYGGDGRYTV